MKRCIISICSILLAFSIIQTAVLPACALEIGTVEELPGQTAEACADSDDAAAPIEEETAEDPEDTESADAEAEPADEEAGEESEAQQSGSSETVPLYFQTDYPDNLYGSGTIASSGCSITSLAMVATYLTGHTYLPDELADYFGGYVGNNMERLEYASDMLQLPWKKATNWHEALKAMQDGCIVIVLMNQNSAFTDSQHFMVLTGLTEDGRVLVNDPYEPNYSRWDLKDGFANGFSQGYISTGYSGSWIYDPSAMPEEPFIYVEEQTPYVEPRYPEFDLTEEEINLLARMVWVEAQGEPLDGQQAVAEVVLNRLADENFPNTLKGVIYAEDQFGSTPYLDDAQPTQTQYEAIERALYGPYVLPMDVVFFAQYAVNRNVWGKIGGHIFCYCW